MMQSKCLSLTIFCPRLIFHRLTQSAHRMMARRGFNSVIVYLDDFLVIAPTREACQLSFFTLLERLQDLGFSISWNKVIEPTQKLVFLGVELDTQHCQLTLPKQKLTELQSLVTSFLSKRRANKKQLQQLAGKLDWACCVVYGGRTFLRQILDMMNSLQSPSAKARLSADFYEDIPFCKFSMANAPFFLSSPLLTCTPMPAALLLVHSSEATGFTIIFRVTPQCLQISILTTRSFLPKSPQHFGGVIHGPSSIL